MLSLNSAVIEQLMTKILYRSEISIFIPLFDKKLSASLRYYIEVVTVIIRLKL